MRLLSRAARLKYGLADLGEAPPSRVRLLAHAINEQRGGTDYVHAGELSALALMQDLLAGALTETALGEDAGALDQALAALDEQLGSAAVDELLAEFHAEFDADRAEGAPTDEVEHAGQAEGAGKDAAAAARRAAVAALFVLWQLNRNPAVGPLRELIDDRRLASRSYAAAMRLLEEQLRTATRGAVPLAGDLVDRLEAPARAEPESIGGQLRLYLDQPTEALGVPRQRLERALDVLAEERVRLPPAQTLGPGPGKDSDSGFGQNFPSIEVAPVSHGEPIVYARLPRDEPAWMRELVLTAKHTHVWLDQLARSAGTEITRLDQVPERELARLVDLGITGLWLVGVWERSAASRRIKELGGNPDAASSAYSVFDYQVAADLGGDEALLQLQERALEHGLRLGVDVVPNHFGIDSRWVREHPERFLAVERCPFPGYSFKGPDLSEDPAIGIYLEDHYYDRSDAAVVFRHLDRASGRERFIYHGNDGTTTPWNDTAQLDYTQSEVRAAMTQLMVDLASRYSILRFDAAMTLTQLHFQRLWFPAPGSGGAVPSRSEHGLSSEAFRRLMPSEFWLEVVDRVEAEAPDTLLVAEAFWLMEPYFVRELGMHRVYNSAFMHLVRERDNSRFQRLLRDTAERDPELLRRSTNFMTTPDEASAAEQFGTGDRYFGACTLLAALPGLPLFGHGQIEGLSEKYGMEYLRAREREEPDEDFVARHRREIEPLLAARGRFAEPERLHVLDFIGPGGYAWHDVYAVCSVAEGTARLVLFNNSDRTVRGTLSLGGSVTEFTDTPTPTGQRELPASDLAGLLGLDAATDATDSKDGVDAPSVTLSDERLGVSVQCRLADLRADGLEIELGPWQALVLSPSR